MTKERDPRQRREASRSLDDGAGRSQDGGQAAVRESVQRGADLSTPGRVSEFLQKVVILREAAKGLSDYWQSLELNWYPTLKNKAERQRGVKTIIN